WLSASVRRSLDLRSGDADGSLMGRLPSNRVFGQKDADAPGGDIDRVTFAEVQFSAAVRGEIDFDRQSEIGDLQVNAGDGAGGINVEHGRAQAAAAENRLAVDLQFMRANVDLGWQRFFATVVGIFKLPVAEKGFAVLHPAMKDVHLAKKIHDEGVGGAL